MSPSERHESVVPDIGTAYRVNAPAVVSEVVDDEVIIINLDSGTYYTLGGSGVVAWDALERGATLDETVSFVVAGHPGVDRAVIATAVEEFLVSVIEEDLVAALTPEEMDGRPVPIPEEVHVPSSAFEPPALERYIDMQALIQLDPVLEVDEHGYPRADGR